MDSTTAGSELTNLLQSLFECAFEDWNTMLGFEARLGGGQQKLLHDRSIVAKVVGRNVIARTRVHGAVDGPIYFLFSPGLIASALTKAMMLPEGEDEPELDETSPAQVEGMQELMNLFCGSATRALDERGKLLRISQSIEDLDVGVGRIPEFDEAHGVTAIGFSVHSGGHAYRVFCLLGGEIAQGF